MSTATVMTCRKCGETLGSSYLYTADGFSYHHACFPVAPRDAETARLQEQVETLTREKERFAELYGREAAAHMAYREAAEAERDRLRDAIERVLSPAPGVRKPEPWVYGILKVALQKEPKL